MLGTMLAKSILSVESARSLGWATATIARFSNETLSELLPGCLFQATLIKHCKTSGTGISYSLSINAVIYNSRYLWFRRRLWIKVDSTDHSTIPWAKDCVLEPQ